MSIVRNTTTGDKTSASSSTNATYTVQEDMIQDAETMSDLLNMGSSDEPLTPNSRAWASSTSDETGVWQDQQGAIQVMQQMWRHLDPTDVQPLPVELITLCGFFVLFSLSASWMHFRRSTSNESSKYVPPLTTISAHTANDLSISHETLRWYVKALSQRGATAEKHNESKGGLRRSLLATLIESFQGSNNEPTVKELEVEGDILFNRALTMLAEHPSEETVSYLNETMLPLMLKGMEEGGPDTCGGVSPASRVVPKPVHEDGALYMPSNAAPVPKRQSRSL